MCTCTFTKTGQSILSSGTLLQNLQTKHPASLESESRKSINFTASPSSIFSTPTKLVCAARIGQVEMRCLCKLVMRNSRLGPLKLPGNSKHRVARVESNPTPIHALIIRFKRHVHQRLVGPDVGYRASTRPHSLAALCCLQLLSPFLKSIASLADRRGMGKPEGVTNWTPTAALEEQQALPPAR